MPGLNSVNAAQQPEKQFSYNAMKEYCKYLNTANLETAAIAASGTVAIASTAGKGVMINGQVMKSTADAEMLIASSTAETNTAWATATAYTVGLIRTNEGYRLRCISAHTSTADDEPLVGYDWDTKWEVAPHGAVNAAGTSITASYDQWFLVTAIADGTLQIWEAGDEAATGYAEMKMPQFDPKLYVALGAIHIANGSSAAFVVGTTSWATGSVTETYVQITGPVFPHADNMDKN